MFFSRTMVALSLSLALVMIGVNSQAGWLFWLAALLLSAILVSWVFSLAQVRKLSVSREVQAEVGEEELLDVSLRVRNRGRGTRQLLEVIDDDPRAEPLRRRYLLKPPRKTLKQHLRELRREGPEPEPAQGTEGRAAFLITRLEGGGETVIDYKRRGLRRGIYRDWPCFFYSEGLLGLARHSSRVKVKSRLVVFPGYAELGSFPLVDSFLHPQKIPRYHQSKGVGADYYGVREYRPGDPLKHVHWKTSARRGQLVVREFEREVGTPLVILIDNNVGPAAEGRGFTCLDAAARLAATVTRYAYYAGHPVSLAASGGERAAFFDVPSFRAALEWLAALGPDGASSPESLLEEVSAELVPGSYLCYILPNDRLESGVLSRLLPPTCHVSLVLVDAGGRDNGRSHESGEQTVRRLAAEPFRGLHSVSLFREGEDLQRCLEKPLLTYDSYQRRGK